MVNILKYKRIFPPPRWGRVRVGVDRNFSHLYFSKGEKAESLTPLGPQGQVLNPPLLSSVWRKGGISGKTL
jgi:hypothetical protein